MTSALDGVAEKLMENNSAAKTGPNDWWNMRHSLGVELLLARQSRWQSFALRPISARRSCMYLDHRIWAAVVSIIAFGLSIALRGSMTTRIERRCPISHWVGVRQGPFITRSDDGPVVHLCAPRATTADCRFLQSFRNISEHRCPPLQRGDAPRRSARR